MSAAASGRIAGLWDGVPLPVLVVDRQARMIGANPAARAMFGPDLLDRPFVTVLRHPAVVQAVEWALTPDRHPAPVPDPDLTAGEEGVTLRAVIGVDGRDISALVTVSALKAVPGGGALVVLQDRTTEEQAEQMRRDFVANVSHELRTPLTAMTGFIETLRGPARNDAAARDRFLDIMEGEAARMNRLIEDLLSLSRVQSEERRRPSTPLDLPLLLRGVVNTMAPMAEAAGVRIETEGLEGSLLLPGDPDQLVQVFQNLIGNAVKYGGSGGLVRVSMRRLAHEALLRGPGWAVEVEDRGEGIDEIHLPRLTERFYRVDRHRARTKGGTGLGLAIVKHIVSRHRGRLRIESRKGQGSRFTVILPESLSRIATAG